MGKIKKLLSEDYFFSYVRNTVRDLKKEGWGLEQLKNDGLSVSQIHKSFNFNLSLFREAG